MTFLYKIATFILIVFLAGCCCSVDENCKCPPVECPCDPCASPCPKPKDCAPTVEQLRCIERKDFGRGCCNPLPLLYKKGIQVIDIGDNAIIILPTDQFFEVGCQHIRSDAHCTLNALAYFLKCYYPCIPLYISGHTDNVASTCRNCWLSDAQAQSIRAYLWIRGIHFSLMCTSGCGQYKPIANQITVAGNTANRRIEIRIRRVC